MATSKKKKKYSSFDQYVEEKYGDKEIGPVKEETNSWFQSGAMEDGFSLKNLGKAILGTAGDVLEDLGAGALGMGEKALDALLYAAPLVAEGQYYQNGGIYQPMAVQELNKSYFDAGKQGNAEIIAKDLYNEEQVIKSIISNPIKSGTGFDIEKSSVFGSKMDSLAQSGGQLLGTAGLQAVGVPWFLTTGATSFGSETENALNQGASYEEAGLSAAVSAGAEILTEKLSGGIKFGGKTLDDALTKKLASSISNKVVRNGLQIGMDFVGEGSEEVISSVFSNLGSVLYKEEDLGEILFSEEALEEYADSFLGGGILGGVSSTGKVIKSGMSGTDAVTGLTKNEQKVFDKVYNDAIAEQEADGKKLTAKEKSKIYDSISNALEKGYIDTDTIESTLGGDNYTTYKNLTEKQSEMQKEYDELYKMKNIDKSDAQIDRQAELKGELANIKKQIDNLKPQIDSDIAKYTQGSKLAESYNEKARKGDTFTADLTKYDAKQKEVVKKAMDSGILNNTNRTHDFVDMVAKISAEKDISFDFTNNQKLKDSGFAVDGKTVNGFVNNNNVTLNIDSAKSLNSVVGHEITHVLEGTELYRELQNIAKEYAKTKGEYDTRLQAITKLYEGVEGADIDAEITADLIGDYLFTDSDFISRLSTEKPNIFKRIFDEIKYLYNVATAGSKEARELEKVKKAFEKAYREVSKSREGVKYSIGEIIDENNKSYGIGVHLDSTLLDNLTPDERKEMVKERIKELGGEKFTAYDNNGNAVDVIVAKPGASFRNQNGKRRPVNKDLTSKFIDNEVKQEAVVLIDELITTSKFQGTDAAKHAHGWLDNDGKNDWDAWTTYIQDKNNAIWKATLHIANTVNGEKIIYDVAPIKKVGQSGKSDTSPTTYSISQNSEKSSGDVTYSLSDSEGNQLTKRQQEFFKDSKNRDEDGNLKVMYHGTGHGGFTVFNRDYSDDGRSFFFTDSLAVAKGYSGTYNEIAPGKKMSVKEMNDIISDSYRFVEHSDGEYRIVHNKYGDLETEYSSKDYDEFVEYLQEWYGESEVNGNYKVYLNLKNPLIVDGEGNNWDELPSIDVREAMTTRDYAEYAEENGYDGVIINNVLDTALYASGKERFEPSTIAIAFKSNQIKSVNNENPTEDTDIRNSLSEEGNIPTQNGNYNVYGKDISLNQDIAPTEETVQEQPVTVQDYGPTASDSENWREIARNLREPELEDGSWTDDYISYYNSVKTEVQQSALREVLDNVDRGMTQEELKQKSKEAYREHERVQAVQEGEYTEAEGLMLTALYYQYSLYDSIAKNPSYANVVREQIEQPYAHDEDSVVSEIAPTVEETTTPQQESIPSVAENVAPTTETATPVQTEEVAPKSDEQVAKVLTEEPENGKKKSNTLLGLAEELVDKGLVFEILSKKTKNRNLEAKWNYIRYADGMAQNFIGNGADGVRPLADIQEEVNKAGLTEKLYEYVYHKHNIDRMSLENRYEDVQNKAVFGDSVTADVSREVVSRLESQYPALKKYANEVYAFNNHLRQMLVDGGVISQETADLWSEMYPNYVPIRRAGDVGLNINVPLDTGRTGVNAPVKKAVGGSEDILPLFDTMAQRAFQTYKAVAKNRFGVELKNTLGTTVETEATDVDGIIEGIEAQDELLKEGKYGKNPTFTVFDNGEKVTFEITEDMYNALKPTNKKLAETYKIPNLISNIHRSVLTEFNPAFLARNIIKDAQDVLINSQHPARTYKNFPKAISEMAKKGKWFTEYMKNGGEQNTYFDREKNTFKKEKSGLSKAIGIPFEAISNANNAIERLPRLAEYIASRESGRGIEESMLDAARVTTNFVAGGDFTKYLNRNGATFLNASFQGFTQQVRNVAEAKMNGFKGWAQLATKFAVAGLPVLLLNGLMWDDDEEYDDLSDYVKQNYYIVAKYGDGKFVRIPKGRTVAVIQDALQQTMNSLTGDDEADWEAFADLFVTNLAPNNPVENNILAPIIQAKTNTTWYGDDLVPTRLQDLPPGEQSDESTDAISKWLGEKTNISPYKINYLIDQYTGVVGDVVLPMFTPEAESGDDSLLGNLLAPVRNAFTTDSVMNNQNVSDFYDTSDELTMNAKKSYATDKDVLANKYFNSVKTEVGKLYAEKREIQNSDLSDAEKYYLVREIQKKIDAIAKETLSEYEDVRIDGDYASVGDKQYHKTDNGWEKLDDRQIEKQNNVISSLGISASEYWSNKAEYDVAYESPGKYAVSKMVGGYDKYTAYDDVIGDFDAKDENGNTVRELKKSRTKDYIFGLDLDYGQKALLYRTYYDSQKDKEEYDSVIKKYLNSRDDISYEEIAEIYKALEIQ